LPNVNRSSGAIIVTNVNVLPDAAIMLPNANASSNIILTIDTVRKLDAGEISLLFNQGGTPLFISNGSDTFAYVPLASTYIFLLSGIFALYSLTTNAGRSLQRSVTGFATPLLTF